MLLFKKLLVTNQIVESKFNRSYFNNHLLFKEKKKKMNKINSKIVLFKN